RNLIIFICLLSLVLFYLYFDSIGESSLVSTLAFETQGTDEIDQTYIVRLARVVGAEPIHQEITKEALPFIQPWVLKEINKGHQLADFIPKNQYNNAFHFDNCQFGPSTQNINNLYDQILKTLYPNLESSPNIIKAANLFGMLLHTSQDFYSHSNWVELGRSDIIDESLEKWVILEPYTSVKNSNILVIQGNHIPHEYKLKRDFGSKVVIVNGSQMGLISGMAGSTTGCPLSIALGHYDSKIGNIPGIDVIGDKLIPAFLK